MDALARQAGIEDPEAPLVHLEADEVGSFAVRKSTLASSDASDSSGVDGRKRDCFAQSESGHVHHIRDRVMHAQCGAC